MFKNIEHYLLRSNKFNIEERQIHSLKLKSHTYNYMPSRTNSSAQMEVKKDNGETNSNQL